MKIKALITALVIGSTSIAAAAPIVRDHRAIDRTTIDHRPNGNVQFRRPVRPLPLTWVTLANDTKVLGRASIKVAPTARRFTKLELRADQGRTSIDKVMIVFANGSSQVVNLDANLGKRKPTVSIDLTGNSRSIDRIVLVGRTTGRSSLDVLAI